MDVTIRGDGHYAGVDVLRPPQRLATNINPPECGWYPTSHLNMGGDARIVFGNTTLGMMSLDLPSDLVTSKIQLSVVGIQ